MVRHMEALGIVRERMGCAWPWLSRIREIGNMQAEAILSYNVHQPIHNLNGEHAASR